MPPLVQIARALELLGQEYSQQVSCLLLNKGEVVEGYLAWEIKSGTQPYTQVLRLGCSPDKG